MINFKGWHLNFPFFNVRIPQIPMLNSITINLKIKVNTDVHQDYETLIQTGITNSSYKAV